jgi:hypothetical protein
MVNRNGPMIRLNSPNNEHDRLWGKLVPDGKDFQSHVLVVDYVRTFQRMFWRSIHSCQSCTSEGVRFVQGARLRRHSQERECIRHCVL